MNETNSTYSKKGKNGIDLYALWNEYKSYWWLFLLSVIGCCAIAFLYSMVKLPQYSIQANVLVAEEETDGTSMSRILSGSLFGSSSSVDDEQIIMSSHTVMLQTVKDLGLNKSYVLKKGLFDKSMPFKDAPVDVSYAPAINDTLKNSILFKIWVDEKDNVKIEAESKKKKIAEVENQRFPVTLKTIYGDFEFDKTEYFEPGESFKESLYLSSYAAAAESLVLSVDIDIPNKKANFIKLSMKDANISRSIAILNKIVENYNKKGVEDKQLKGYKTSEFIDNRIALLAQELEMSEKDIEVYKKSNNITDVRAEATYLMGRKGKLETELLTAETENEVLRLTRDFVANPSNKYALIPLSGMDINGQQSAVTSAINKYNDLVLSRMKIENNAKSNNASLKVLNDQIDAMRANIISSLEKAIANSDVALRDLREQTRQSMSKLGEIPTQEREYYNMKRQQTVKEQLFLYLLQQREQTAISIANSMPRGTVIDEAYSLLTPVSMTRKKMLMCAFVLGLLLPIGYITVKNKLRNKFATKSEVEALTDVPVLGEVCLSHRKESVVVRDSSSIAELFRLIRTNLGFVMGSANKVVLVTSTKSGEGKSFVSVNLAASFALLGKKVLLVGMDIRKPQLANYLGISHQPGLTQYLSSEQYKISDIIQKSVEVESLDVVVAGPVPPNPAELLAEGKVDAFFASMREIYDYIIIDSAPVGMVSDTFVLDRVADATVYVCRADYTTLQDIDFVSNLYDEKRLKKLSLIVNGTSVKKGYGYGYGKAKE